MKKFFVITILATGILSFKNLITPAAPEDVKNAINKSLPLLQSSSHTFLVNSGCHSCHGQALGAVTFSLAKEKNFPVGDTMIKESNDSAYNDWKGRLGLLAQYDDPAAILMTGSYDLWGMSETGYKPNKIVELLAINIMHRQNSNGSWVSPNARPPLEYYSFSATALALRAMKNYTPAVLKNEVGQRLEKAKKWMVKTATVTNEERAFQLLGLTWAGQTDKKFIEQQAAKLLATQHEDGGWAQLDSLQSDAYATGQSLYALHQCGHLNQQSPAFQKGIAYLVNTQKADGSWHVRSRAFPSVPFVNSGFPHGGDQFISAAASNWATMALLVAVK